MFLNLIRFILVIRLVGGFMLSVKSFFLMLFMFVKFELLNVFGFIVGWYVDSLFCSCLNWFISGLIKFLVLLLVLDFLCFWFNCLLDFFKFFDICYSFKFLCLVEL